MGELYKNLVDELEKVLLSHENRVIPKGDDWLEPYHTGARNFASHLIQLIENFKNGTYVPNEFMNHDTDSHKKYYLIYHSCVKKSWGHGPNDSHTYYCQDISDKHPLQWQIETNEKYDKVRDDGHGGQTQETYMVISWEDLTKDEYEEYKEHIG